MEAFLYDASLTKYNQMMDDATPYLDIVILKKIHLSGELVLGFFLNCLDGNNKTLQLMVDANGSAGYAHLLWTPDITITVIHEYVT